MNKKIINLKSGEISSINGSCLCICGAFNARYNQFWVDIKIENVYSIAGNKWQVSLKEDSDDCRQNCNEYNKRSTCIDFNGDYQISYDLMPPSPIQKTEYFDE